MFVHVREEETKKVLMRSTFLWVFILSECFIYALFQFQPRPMVQFSHGVPRLCLRCHFGVKLTFCFTLALEIW